MIVYVESNFILELALEQSEVEPCRELIEIAEAGRIELVIPAVAFVEPYEKQHRTIAERNKTYRRFSASMQQLGRTQRYASSADRVIAEVATLVVESVNSESERLDDLLLKLINRCRVIPLHPDVVIQSFQIRSDFGLTPEDAYVFASISLDAQTHRGQKVFISRDRAFADANLTEILRQQNCHYIYSFGDGAQYVDAVA